MYHIYLHYLLDNCNTDQVVDSSTNWRSLPRHRLWNSLAD